MIRISAPWMVESVKTINDLDSLQGRDSHPDTLVVMFAAQTKLIQLYGQSFYMHHFKSSSSLANQLHECIEGAIKLIMDKNEFPDSYVINQIINKRKDFITAFMADLGVLPIYIATPKEGYDIDKLIFNGACIFPASISQKAPDAEKDLMEAGKSLAFELPTACGFHIFRATECVVRRYWDAISAGRERPALQTLGSFAAELEKNQLGDPKVVEALKQMTKLHRNPLIHPEAILSVEEAISIIGIARSVVGAMLSALPDVLETTGSPSGLVAP